MMNSAVRMLDVAAKRFGSRPAIEDESGVITYSEYRETARHIGSGLLAADADRRPVMVYLPKSIRAICSLMGCLYAGCPYVPTDTHMPGARLQKLLEGLRPQAVITDREHLDEFREKAGSGVSPRIVLYEELTETAPDEDALERRLRQVIDSDPIYIMFTSGSTGTPKGVTIPHRGILDYARWVVETFSYTEETRMANQAPLYFDNSTFDIYGCMKSGGCMVIIPENLFFFPVRLPQFLADKDITSIFWVPTVMIRVANSGALDGVSLPKLKTVAFAGEVMPNKQLNIWRAALPEPVYANLYGPTEITDVCCYYIVDRPFADNDPLPLGLPCENMRALVLREDGTQAAPGEHGDLCISGSGVYLGYWNAPELTAKAYRPLSSNRDWSEWFYHTGDLAYLGEDGLLYFCGRKDNQVKIRGNRIELGEVENAARMVEGVTNVCAVFDEKAQEIVLFAEMEEPLTTRKYQREMRKYVPAYMIPGQVVFMKALPQTPNKKIDRVTLRRTLEEN